MINERNGHRSALVLFAVAVTIAMLVAFVTTLELVDKRTADSEAAPVRRASPRHIRHLIAHRASRS